MRKQTISFGANVVCTSPMCANVYPPLRVVANDCKAEGESEITKNMPEVKFFLMNVSACNIANDSAWKLDVKGEEIG